MQTVITIVDTIRKTEGAAVDNNFGQGRDIFIEQVQSLHPGSTVTEQDYSLFEYFLVEAQNFVLPYELPADYIFFLKFYGGLHIQQRSHNMSLLGIGPMVNTWYQYLMGDDGYCKDGVIYISKLALKGRDLGKWVNFYIDLVGSTQQYAIISMPSWTRENLSQSTILSEPSNYPDQWKLLASSFTDWLTLVAQTKGSCGYI